MQIDKPREINATVTEPRPLPSRDRQGAVFPKNDVVATTRGGILMDVRKRGGDFLVVRASGTAAYNSYIRGLCPALNSVATLIVHSRAGAEQLFVKDAILKAEALFIASGDQSNYVKYYAGTPVAAAINALAARGVPVGGTSPATPCWPSSAIRPSLVR